MAIEVEIWIHLPNQSDFIRGVIVGFTLVCVYPNIDVSVDPILTRKRTLPWLAGKQIVHLSDDSRTLSSSEEIEGWIPESVLIDEQDRSIWICESNSAKASEHPEMAN